MASMVEIFNMALANIGQGEQVADENERSQAARTCRMFYTQCRDQMLAEFDWPFARKRQVLAQVSAVDDRYQFTYQMPSDCLRILSVLAEKQLDPRDVSQAPAFTTAYSTEGQVILCDVPQAIITYTCRLDEVERFSPLAVEALGYLLASKIAMPMTVNSNLVQNNLTLYQNAVSRAMAHALNQQQRQRPELPQLIRARF